MLREANGRARNRFYLVTVTVMLMSAGCGGTGGPSSASGSTTPDISASSVSSPPSSISDDRTATEAAYREVWSRVHQVITLPEAQWRPALSEVLVDPQLTTTLQAISYQKQIGITTYGAETARIESVDVSGGQATLKDCQDASHSGQADSKTGKPKTVGVPRNPITASLVKANGQWKVSKITYPGGTC